MNTIFYIYFYFTYEDSFPVYRNDIIGSLNENGLSSVLTYKAFIYVIYLINVP